MEYLQSVALGALGGMLVLALTAAWLRSHRKRPGKWLTIHQNSHLGVLLPDRGCPYCYPLTSPPLSEATGTSEAIGPGSDGSSRS